MHFCSELETPVYAVAAITAELDAIGRHALPAPGLQRCAADTAGVAVNRRKCGDAGLDDDHVLVTVFAIQNGAAVAALDFTHG